MATSGTVAYEAINEITGHRYIGVTVKGLDARRHRHLSEARCGSRLRFHRAIRKYGEEAFRFDVIADFGGDFDLALAFEAEEIAKSNPDYNTTAGGRGVVGHTHSDETRAKMRAAKLGSVGPWKGIPRPEIAAYLSMANQKVVRCVEDGRQFESAVAAAKFYGVDARALAGVASGKRRQKSVGGRRFVYVGG